MSARIGALYTYTHPTTHPGEVLAVHVHLPPDATFERLVRLIGREMRKTADVRYMSEITMYDDNHKWLTLNPFLIKLAIVLAMRDVFDKGDDTQLISFTCYWPTLLDLACPNTNDTVWAIMSPKDQNGMKPAVWPKYSKITIYNAGQRKLYGPPRMDMAESLSSHWRYAFCKQENTAGAFAQVYGTMFLETVKWVDTKVIARGAEENENRRTAIAQLVLVSDLKGDVLRIIAQMDYEWWWVKEGVRSRGYEDLADRI